MPVDGRADTSEEVASAVRTVKEVVAVLTGLALTNSVVVLLTRGSYSNVTALQKLPVISILFGVVIIATIVRFHLANARHMDAAFGRTAEAKYYRGPSLGADSVTAILQSGMLAIMSFYVNDPHTILILLLILLSSDTVWTVANIGQGEIEPISYQRAWLLNTVATCIVLVLVIIIGHRTSLYLGAIVVLMYTACDLIISWSFYFPSSGSRVI